MVLEAFVPPAGVDEKVMSGSPRVILLELNELTPTLIFRFMAEGRLPHFQRLHDEAKVFTSDAEETGLDLNPWVQWVTVHTGLRLAEHGVELLGEGGRMAGQGVADVVSEAGLPVWLCGSMNVRTGKELNGAALPDPWATDARPRPAELEPYFRFVQHHVSEHTNPDSRFGAREPRFRLGFTDVLPAAVVERLAGWLFGSPWFASRVVVDRWFVHAHEPVG